MPKVIITGDGKSWSSDVEDASDAVRQVAKDLKKVGTDSSILNVLQTWANGGFKRPLRMTIAGKAVVIDYRP